MPATTPPANTDIRTVLAYKTDTAKKGHFTATTTAKRLFANNPKRVALSIVNSSAQTIYIGFDKAVTAIGGRDPGYELLSGGTWDDDHYTGEYWVVVAAATSDISYIEM